jgi:hypothetical protein
MQLPIYLLAAGGAVMSQLRFLKDGKSTTLTEEIWTSSNETFALSVEQLIGSARSGDFTPDPRDSQACKFCEFRAPCGVERSRLFDRKKDDPRVAARLALRESS